MHRAESSVHKAVFMLAHRHGYIPDKSENGALSSRGGHRVATFFEIKIIEEKLYISY